MRLDVLVVGDANPDLVLRGDVRPRFGQEEQLLDAADLVLGGSAAITAAGCARLGLRTGSSPPSAPTSSARSSGSGSPSVAWSCSRPDRWGRRRPG